ncbi:MAG: hypothetical protein M3305_04545 [Actinomycetota bacterium]|nr:hypothetical protein [Actinomycetota bacterium]
MSRSSAIWLAWYMCVLSLALTALSLFLLLLNLSHSGIHISEPWDQHSVIAVAFSIVGAVIVSRRSETTVGWIFCTIGLLAGVVHLSSAYAVYALLAEPGSLPGGELAAWMRSWDWVPYLGLFVFLFLLFPNGRAQSNRWRWFAWLVGVVVVVGTIMAAYSPGPIDAIGPVENPLGIELLKVVQANAAVGPIETLLYILGLIAVVSLFARMRRARDAERQQLKWFAYATAVLVSGSIVAYIIAEATNIRWLWWVGFIISTIGLVGLPVSMGIAILRYRLYNIDLIINRTLVYAVLTAILALLYFGSVTLLQYLLSLLTGEGGTLAIVASTLAIAALFNPLRRRIQGFIDQRFYRRQYDAAKTLEAFGARLRDETDLEKISDDLVEVVNETMQPSHISIWLSSLPSSPRSSERVREISEGSVSHTSKAERE